MPSNKEPSKANPAPAADDILPATSLPGTTTPDGGDQGAAATTGTDKSLGKPGTYTTTNGFTVTTF